MSLFKKKIKVIDKAAEEAVKYGVGARKSMEEIVDEDVRLTGFYKRFKGLRKVLKHEVYSELDDNYEISDDIAASAAMQQDAVLNYAWLNAEKKKDTDFQKKIMDEDPMSVVLIKNEDFGVKDYMSKLWERKPFIRHKVKAIDRAQDLHIVDALEKSDKLNEFQQKMLRTITAKDAGTLNYASNGFNKASVAPFGTKLVANAITNEVPDLSGFEERARREKEQKKEMALYREQQKAISRHNNANKRMCEEEQMARAYEQQNGIVTIKEQ